MLTPEWQEITLSDFDREISIGDILYHGAWEGELSTIALFISADEVPEWLEVDRILLTGVEEQLQGELPPPAETVHPGPGTLFTVREPVFIADGLAPGRNSIFLPLASLIDWDRDGDLDGMAYWEQLSDDPNTPYVTCGWVMAANDGVGGFMPRLTRPFADCGVVTEMIAGDVDGDGEEELVVGRGFTVAVWRSTDSLEPEVMWHSEGRSLLGVAEATGDGRVEVITLSVRPIVGDEVENTLEAWTYRGGGFAVVRQSARVDLRSPEGAGDYNGNGSIEVLWAPLRSATVRQVTTLEGEPAQPDGLLDSGVGRFSLVYVGDVDRDGDVDLIGGREGESILRGVDIWQNAGQGNLVQHPWYDVEIELGGAICAGELNGDGMRDLAFVNGDVHTGPAVVVNLGREGGLPQEEGWYPLDIGGGTILGGDVDGDEDEDLVVFDSKSGKLQVLINQSREGITAVEAEADYRGSVGFRLGANYPNPFNPQTWIPFEVSRDGGFVDLRIYNILGQPICTLVAGRLGVGHHRVSWDGRNTRGEAVSAGVYLYRLQTDDGQITRKMLKVE